VTIKHHVAGLVHLSATSLVGLMGYAQQLTAQTQDVCAFTVLRTTLAIPVI